MLGISMKPDNTSRQTDLQALCEEVATSGTIIKWPKADQSFKTRVVWKNAIGFLMLHLLAVYGLYLSLVQAKLLTIAWGMFIFYTSAFGVTLTAHRLYSHRTFKATPGLRTVLLVLHTMAGQNCVYIWARDHRQHHMYSDTVADPHNSTRGFFFSHIGWLMVRKHPAVIAAGKTVDMTDLEADPLVMFQKNYYKRLYLVLALLPLSVPCLLWGESWWVSFVTVYVLRNVILLNITWTVNSAAHLYGNHPYDKNIIPKENRLVSFLTGGEGWHNYHHTYPYDYRASEFGMKHRMSTMVIDYFATKGWAYDLRSVSKDVVLKKVLKSGDGTHHMWGEKQHQNNNLQKS